MENGSAIKSSPELHPNSVMAASSCAGDELERLYESRKAVASSLVPSKGSPPQPAVVSCSPQDLLMSHPRPADVPCRPPDPLYVRRVGQRFWTTKRILDWQRQALRASEDPGAVLRSVRVYGEESSLTKTNNKKAGFKEHDVATQCLAAEKRKATQRVRHGITPAIRTAMSTKHCGTGDTTVPTTRSQYFWNPVCKHPDGRLSTVGNSDSPPLHQQGPRVHYENDGEHPHCENNEEDVPYQTNGEHTYYELENDDKHVCCQNDEEHAHCQNDEKHVHYRTDVHGEHTYYELENDHEHVHYQNDEEHVYYHKDEERAHYKNEEEHAYYELDNDAEHAHYERDEEQSNLSTFVYADLDPDFLALQEEIRDPSAQPFYEMDISPADEQQEQPFYKMNVTSAKKKQQQDQPFYEMEVASGNEEKEQQRSKPVSSNEYAELDPGFLAAQDQSSVRRRARVSTEEGASDDHPSCPQSCRGFFRSRPRWMIAACVGVVIVVISAAAIAVTFSQYSTPSTSPKVIVTVHGTSLATISPLVSVTSLCSSSPQLPVTSVIASSPHVSVTSLAIPSSQLFMTSLATSESIEEQETSDRTSGADIITFSGHGSEAKKLGWSFGVAVSPDSKIWVADLDQTHLQVYSMKGVHLYQFPPGAESVCPSATPYGVSIGTDGHVWVLCRAYSARPDYVRQLGLDGQSKANFDLPNTVNAVVSRGFAVDLRNNHIFVTWSDGQKGGVQAFEPNGKHMWDVGRQQRMASPMFVAVDGQGNIFVSDFGNNLIYVYDEDGQFVLKFRGPRTRGIRLDGPRGICVDSSGYVLVVDSRNQRVLMYTGRGRYVRQIDIASKHPRGVAVGPGGQLVVTSGDGVTVFHRY